jgi:Bacteriophage HK97-gp10, putative tail-component
MNISVKIDVEGIAVAMANKASKVRHELELALTDSSALLVTRAQQNSPVDTSLMVRSIEDREAPYASGTEKEGLIREVIVNAPYAGYVEYGYNQPPENVAWFRRSIEDVRPTIENIIVDAARNALE